MSDTTPEKNDHINYPVYLSEGKVENFPDAINLFLEYFLFFRWIYFKNRPRGNLLLLRSILVVSVFASLYYSFYSDFSLVLEGIEIDPMMAFGGAVAISYWNMTTVFHKKSESCSHMYTEMIKSGGSGDMITAKSLSNALAVELITLDLWAHRKYRPLFARNLYRAIEHAYSTESAKITDMHLPNTAEQMVKHINEGHLQAKEARILLDNYQDYLMFSTNKHYSEKAKAA